MTVLNTVFLPQNKGLGNALRESINRCSNSLVARMDSDDISEKHRFRVQLERFMANPKLDVVGGIISEFDGREDNITGFRVVPESDTEIKAYAKKRCPVNHVSVMYKREAVLSAGGYLDWYCNEDYYLWLRMIENGSVFENIQKCLVNVRTGKDMSSRRGGWKYFESEKNLQLYMLRHRIIGLPRFIYNTAVRFAGEVVIPNSIRHKDFHLMREHDKEYGLAVNEAAEKSCETENEVRYPPFSVAMSVYGKDNAEWFDLALESVTLKQTVKPSEIVLVVDGPVPEEIHRVIEKYQRILGGGIMKTIFLVENKGLGNALRLATENCKYSLIARMDSDDIAVEDRFEQQLRRFVLQPELDIVGGDINEFIDDTSNFVGRRAVPTDNIQIYENAKKRCPMNHMTVMFRSEAVKSAGGYIDWHYNEDYYLWIRMMQHRAIFANTGTVLVNVRVGEDMYRRRGGYRYFKSEAKIQKYMLENHIIGSPRFMINVAERFVLQVLMPNSLRGWIFKMFARTGKRGETQNL